MPVLPSSKSFSSADDPVMCSATLVVESIVAGTGNA
jgi:hypothetical protein